MMRFSRRLQLCVFLGMLSMAAASCGGGGSGPQPTALSPQVSSGDYSAPAGGLSVSRRPVSNGSDLVYQIELPDPGRTAAVQAELKYDPSVLTIKSVRTVGPMESGISEFNDSGNGAATIVAVNARTLESGGAILEVTATPKIANVPDGALVLSGYELTNIEGKSLGRSSLARVLRRSGDRTADCSLKCGDVDGDGLVSQADAVEALRIAIGLSQAGESELCAGDMAPTDAPDGMFTAADDELILRRVDELGVTGCGTPGTVVSRPLGEENVTMNAETFQRTVSDELIVMFQPGTAAETIDRIAEANDLRAVGRNSVTGAWEFRVDASAISAARASLSNDPNVASVEDNPVLDLMLTPNDPNFTSTSNANRWGYEKIQAPSAWDISTGSPGTIIAVVDTGIDSTHPEFAGRVVPGYNFIANSSDAKDDNGHGTHVSGIAAGMGNNGIGMAGGCWNCRIMPVKVLDASGSGSLYAIMNGVTWAAQHGARVINLSLGGKGSPGQSEITTIRNARAAGAIVIVAAGNSNADASGYTPAGVPEAVTVASTTSTDARSSFSNYGSVVDIAAPGSSIYSTLPTYHVTLNDQGAPMNYAVLSGTSMATPMVSGIAGLLFSLNASFTPDQVESYLKSNVDAIQTDRPIGGRLNAFKALSAAKGGVTNQPPSVSLSALPSSGVAPLAVSFNATCSDPDGTCASYAWNFGDGAQTTTTANTTSHTYLTSGTFTTTVTAADNLGAKTTAIAQVAVSAPAGNSLTVSISADKTSGAAPLKVNFTATCASSAGSCVSYTWNFGGLAQKTTTVNSSSYSFKTVGTYSVKVTALDGAGATAQATLTVTVSAPPGHPSPAVSISADKSSGRAPLTITFTGSATATDGSIVSAYWDFGDYHAYSLRNNPARVTYQSAGTYVASITATDNYGATTKKSLTITVSP